MKMYRFMHSMKVQEAVANLERESASSNWLEEQLAYIDIMSIICGGV